MYDHYSKRKVLYYCKRSAHLRPKIKEIAMHFGVSPTTIERAVLCTTELTVKQHIDSLLAQTIRAMLKTGKKCAKEIAVENHFPSVHSLYKWTKRNCGCTLRTLRISLCPPRET